MLRRGLGIASVVLLVVIVLVCFSNMSAEVNPVYAQDSNREPFRPLEVKIFTISKSLINDGHKNDAEREMENFFNNSNVRVKFITQSSGKDTGTDYDYTSWTIFYTDR